MRTFVALDLPERPRAALAAWRDALIAGREDLRPVPAEALHVTLVFLGWQGAEAVDSIATAAFGAAAGLPAPELRAAGVQAVPPRGPRLFALDLHDRDGRAGAVQGAVASVLSAGGWYEPERRPFWPHVTLARVRRGARRVARPPDDPAPPSEPFAASALTLYRSHLSPRGARYEPLARVEL